MKKQDFEFELPAELIAAHPLAQRSASRLLCLARDTGEVSDRQFTDLVSLLNPGDLLVFNDTRVIPARLFGQKDTGGSVEVLVERILDSHRVLAHTRASKSPKPGRTLTLEGCLSVQVIARHDDLFELAFPPEKTVLEWLDECGRIPLPPYIEREAGDEDKSRYQTVYAREPGAVAAPTAGLHFDEDLIARIRNNNVDIEYVTLHVGAGTFQTVRVDNIAEHVMHAEQVTVSAGVCEKVRQTKAKGGRVIAVGTTVVRCLETASASGAIQPYSGDTNIFIYPGYQFRTVDALVTNFHLPGSTLIVLVSAFAGRENVLNAYRHAIAQGYRFYSYGDAMFIS